VLRSSMCSRRCEASSNASMISSEW
jgi:hypothetical protein